MQIKTTIVLQKKFVNLNISQLLMKCLIKCPDGAVKAVSQKHRLALIKVTLCHHIFGNQYFSEK